MRRRAPALLVMLATMMALSQTVSAEGRARGCGDQPTTSFTQLFTGAVAGFGTLGSKSSIGLLTAGGAAAFAAHTADYEVSTTLSSSKSLHETLEAGQYLGGTPLQLGAAFATYGLGRALNHPCAASLGADLVQAQLVAEGLSIALKQSVRRTRPDGTGYSFPSGHTTVSFASATVIQRHFGWKAGIPAYAVATYVGASRVQMKRHYLSDVAFGAALGIVAGRAVTIKTGAYKFAVSPMTMPGAGVSFTLLDKR